ncbi:MAG: thioredoxin fold domain-containing protein [Gemmatimonadetes bacterium]|nr:thioredoxin fold domain-containing protein [Gemmatimonadota bacterium]
MMNTAQTTARTPVRTVARTIARIIVWAGVVGTAACMTACETYQAPSSQLPGSAVDGVVEPAAEAHVDDIVWFEGSVDEAFAKARSEDRPVYFYWGAVWCPPCQEIKNTVFKSQQFIALSQLFIPVYLDGDTDRAQTWGETFGVKGYPTMIVFNPAGEEITRIPGGIDISRYNSVLALSLEHLRPTSMLVELATDSPDELIPSDYQQLAYYSWGQDDGALPDDASPDLFQTLAARVRASDPEASARLHLQGLVLLAESSEGDSTTLESLAAPDQLRAILDSPELVLACWDYLAYWPEEISGVLGVEGDEKDALTDKWSDVVLGARHHKALSTAEQLGGWFPYLTFYQASDEDKALPDDIIAGIRADGRKASEQTRNAYARQSVVSMISYLYRSAKLTEDARQLLLAELDRSAAPYYFMSGLASLAEEEEKATESLEWRRQAYEASQGKATRFQWGVGYVSALVRLQPENHGKIEINALAILDDLEAAGEPFVGRNLSRLKRLNGTLRAWDEEQGELENASSYLQDFDARLDELCSDQVAGSTGETHCTALLAEEEASGS